MGFEGICINCGISVSEDDGGMCDVCLGTLCESCLDNLFEKFDKYICKSCHEQREEQRREDAYFEAEEAFMMSDW